MTISQRRHGFLTLVAVCCWFAAPSTAAESTAADRAPNIVLIISDDQAYGDYSFMGHSQVQTPNIDRLAAEGLTFTRGYVPSSLCRPSLASMITGLYPHQHGIVGNDPWRPASQQAKNALIAKIDAVETLPQMLAPLGYVSHQSGKWWEGNFRRGGFTAGMTHGDPERGGRHGDEGLKIGRQGLAPITEFIDQATAGNKPFFLWYAPFLPHTPHNPPQRLLEKYVDKTDSLPIAKYWAMCEWFDETCGRLIDEIDNRGLSEETIFIYVTDNGWINDPEESRYAPRSKRSPNEGGIRTPIMIRWKGKVEPKMNQTDLASSLDLVPTILAAVGAPPREGLPGINLLDSVAVSSRKTLYGEIFEHDVPDLNDPRAGLRYLWVIDEDWKMIEPNPTVVEGESDQLYNLANDPDENIDLAAENLTMLARLQNMLAEYQQALVK